MEPINMDFTSLYANVQISHRGSYVKAFQRKQKIKKIFNL
jgi:hypothetical protein